MTYSYINIHVIWFVVDVKMMTFEHNNRYSLFIIFKYMCFFLLFTIFNSSKCQFCVIKSTKWNETTHFFSLFFFLFITVKYFKIMNNSKDFPMYGWLPHFTLISLSPSLKEKKWVRFIENHFFDFSL